MSSRKRERKSWPSEACRLQRDSCPLTWLAPPQLSSRSSNDDRTYDTGTSTHKKEKHKR
jgi:hypothetical protein